MIAALPPRHPQAAAKPAAPVEAGKQTPSAETGIDNFLRLMRKELAEPLKHVAELAERIEEMRASGFLPNTISGERTFADLAATARRTATLAGRVIQLGDVLTGTSILADERILLIDALRDAAGGTVETARRRHVGIRLDDGRQNLAPVYGSMTWLSLAMRQLITMLVEAAPGGTHVLLRMRQVGFHQLVTGTVNHGRVGPSTLDLLPPTRASVKAELAGSTQVYMIDLALARAVIELHGGTLKTDVTEGGKLNEFHLTLPTGESQAMRERPDCGNCPHMRQAEQFAQDIGELLNTLGTMQQHLDSGSHS